MKKVNQAIENCTKKLFKEEQSIYELKENLTVIYENWFHPSIERHKKVMFEYQTLKELLNLLILSPTKQELINNKIISFFSVHTTEGVSGILLCFKDLFINYIDPTDGSYSSEVYIKKFKTYNIISNFLIELTDIESDFYIQKISN